MEKTWYYYLHTDGNIIGKNPIVVDDDPEYFQSDFVVKVWLINLTDRKDAWTLILEALALGGNKERIKELIDKWGCDLNDAKEMFIRLDPTPLFKKGLDIYLKEFYQMDFEDFLKIIGGR